MGREKVTKGRTEQTKGHGCTIAAGLNFPRPVTTFLDPMRSFVDHRAEDSSYFSLWSNKPHCPYQN